MNKIKGKVLSVWYFSKYSPYQLFFTSLYLFGCTKILFNTKSVRLRTEELLEYLASLEEFCGDSVAYLSRVAIGIQHFECSARYTSRLFHLLEHATGEDMRKKTLSEMSSQELRQLIWDFAYPNDEVAIRYAVRWANEEPGYIPDTLKYSFDKNFPIEGMVA